MNKSTTKGVAIVTGAASGIGKAIAEKLAMLNYSVCLTDVNEAKLLEEESHLRQKLCDITAFTCDITCEDSVKALVDYTVNMFGSLNILVNCAGISPVGRVIDISEKDFRKALDINLVAPFLLSKYSIPYMIKADHACIVNIAGTLGSKAIRSKAAYCASKGGITNLTRQMALDFGDYGIRVNSVSPGFADTPLNNGMENNTREIIVESQALHETIEASDIAEAVAFICSDSAKLITGADLVVDAGQSASQGSLSAVDYVTWKNTPKS